jgi:hypothetical protein
MAFAGNPTGLAQQAGTSHPWKAMLAAIAVMTIGLALVIAVLFVNSRAVTPTTGRSDAAIESQRDATLRAGIAAPVKVYQLDERPRGTIQYNVVENGRGAGLRTGSALVPAVGRYLDDIQTLRGTKILSGAPVNKTNRNEDFQSLHGVK